jgi:diguanylate cyclase (GGDEF)-like protein
MPCALTDNHDQRTRDLFFYLIDADNFKEVNDRYGHDVGERVLVEMARRISSAIRHSDVLVRWGGEEFLILSRYTDRREAKTLSAREVYFLAVSASRINVFCCCSRFRFFSTSRISSGCRAHSILFPAGAP